jgi:hypothetical protein
MHRTGVMAPPTLYELPARAGLMSPTPQVAAPEISVRAMLWSIAAVLASLELVLELSIS